MKYPNGLDVKIGDKVKLWEGCHGIVVASIDTGEYSSNFPKTEWEYLKVGVLIDSDKAGVIHYFEPEKSLELIERAK